MIISVKPPPTARAFRAAVFFFMSAHPAAPHNTRGATSPPHAIQLAHNATPARMAAAKLSANRIRARQMAPRWTRLRAPPIAAARLPRAKRDKLPIISSYRQASQYAMPADKNANIIGSYQLAKPAAASARPVNLNPPRGRRWSAFAVFVSPARAARHAARPLSLRDESPRTYPSGIHAAGWRATARIFTRASSARSTQREFLHSF